MSAIVMVQPAAWPKRAFVSRALQIGRGESHRMGLGTKPLCALESGAAEGSGAGQKRAEKDGDRGEFRAAGRRGGPAIATVAQLSMEFLPGVYRIGEEARMAGM